MILSILNALAALAGLLGKLAGVFASERQREAGSEHAKLDAANKLIDEARAAREAGARVDRLGDGDSARELRDKWSRD